MNEFAKGDIIVCIGSTERWVVWEVSPTLYEVRRMYAFMDNNIDEDDFASMCGGVSKVVAHSDFVKVGRWNFKYRKEETEDAQ